MEDIDDTMSSVKDYLRDGWDGALMNSCLIETHPCIPSSFLCWGRKMINVDITQMMHFAVPDPLFHPPFFDTIPCANSCITN